VGGAVLAHAFIAGVDAGLELMLPHVAEGGSRVGSMRLEVVGRS
jgi:hypothetical protein